MFRFKQFIVLFGLIVLSTSLFAQRAEDGILTGKAVSKSTGQPIGYGSVVLLARADSTIVSGVRLLTNLDIEC